MSSLADIVDEFVVATIVSLDNPGNARLEAMRARAKARLEQELAELRPLPAQACGEEGGQ